MQIDVRNGNKADQPPAEKAHITTLQSYYTTFSAIFQAIYSVESTQFR
jgi:hypothetical protein